MVTDPIADALTRIRNANLVKHQTVSMPASKLKIELVKLLRDEGFIADFQIQKDGKFPVIEITLKYAEGKPVITGLERVSTPGLRSYSKSKKLPKVFDGLGIAVISTNKGLMTDRRARQENLGGEVLCYIW